MVFLFELARYPSHWLDFFFTKVSFKDFCQFSPPILGEMIPDDEHTFQLGGENRYDS